MKEYIHQLNETLNVLFADFKSGIDEREDSRAFGAMIEKRITVNWEKICNETAAEFVPNPGRRTIYDFASLRDGVFYGFDIKTKDLDSDKYSDGGVCAVGNLLKFLAKDKAIFVVVEFGHKKSEENNNLRDLVYINVVPFHLLPADVYRIENLGTGQVRFNRSINQVFDQIEWDRSLDEFFDIFVDKSIKHYRRVGLVAQNRIDAMNKFREGGYGNFKF